MTDCHRQPLHFSTLGPKVVVTDFQGEGLTTDAGSPRLREVAERFGRFDALDAAITDASNPIFLIHDPRVMIAQRGTAIAPGILRQPSLSVGVG